MHRERDGEPVIVEPYIEETDDGSVVGRAKWAAFPDHSYTIEVERHGGVRRLTVSAPAGGTVTARALRAPVAAMEAAVRAEVAAIVAAHRVGPRLRDAEWIEELAADFTDRPRPGAAGRDDEPYAALAAKYVALTDAGERRPVAVLAADLNLASATVRNYLWAARERGLLTTKGKGKPGGELTDTAKEILNGEH